MSLIRQVWLLLALTLVLAFVGATGVSVRSARQYLQTQLDLKNNDTAQALALTLSQQRGDKVALELAMAKLPSVITYRINPITHAYVDRVVKVDYANLINVVLNREAVPELLQYDCTPEKLTAAVTRLLDDKATADAQIDAGQEALKVLGYGGVSPALRAADEVLAVIARNEQRG